MNEWQNRTLKKFYTEAEFKQFKQAWSGYPEAVDVWVRSWGHMEQLFNYGSAVRKVMLPEDYIII